MDRRKLFLAVAALVLVVLAVFGLATRDRGLGDNPDKVGVTDTGATEGGGLDERALQALCASSGVAARLKQVAFEEAFRIRNADPTNLDRLAASSVVRLESPAVRSFDDGSDMVTCAGRFVLELPPGAERAFNGERRLTADIEYSVQSATGGPATVVQMNGAEPLIYRLAAFDLQDAPPPPDAIGNEIAPVDAAPIPVDGEAGELEEDEPVATPDAGDQGHHGGARIARFLSPSSQRKLGSMRPQRVARHSFGPSFHWGDGEGGVNLDDADIPCG